MKLNGTTEVAIRKAFCTFGSSQRPTRKAILCLLLLVWIQVLAHAAEHGEAWLWKDPGNIGARNLTYGAGGEVHAPHSKFKFEKESKAAQKRADYSLLCLKGLRLNIVQV